MFELFLDEFSCVKGHDYSVRITSELIALYDQVQLEILDTCVLNPQSKLSLGTSPLKISEQEYEISFSTISLVSGVYEIGLVRLHSPKSADIAEIKDFLPIRDYPRAIFEIINESDASRNADEIYRQVEFEENRIEKEFCDAVDISPSCLKTKGEYCSFAFVRGLLIGTRFRLHHIEVLPVSPGIGSLDYYEIVNLFLSRSTKTSILFPYNEEVKARSYSDNPVCVVHFPKLNAEGYDQVFDYCLKKTTDIISVLTLLRNASGITFDIIAIDRETNESKMILITPPYSGNLLVGNLSGENPDTFEKYVEAVEKSNLKKFLIKSFHEAGLEGNIDFKLLRYWQILETTADSRNYQKDQILTDYLNEPICNSDGSVKITKGAVNTVFNLLKESNQGNPNSNWENANIWYGLRCAVAHYGSVKEYSKLRSETAQWAEKGYNDLPRRYEQLRDTVKGVLCWILLH